MTIREANRKFKTKYLRSVQTERITGKEVPEEHIGCRGYFKAIAKAVDTFGYERTFKAIASTRCRARTAAIDTAQYSIQMERNKHWRMMYLARHVINVGGDGI